MEKFIQKVALILQEAFPGMEVSISRKKGIHRAGGMVTWVGFEGKRQLDRQEQLHKVLRSNLSRDEELQLGTILTVTPQEIAAIEEHAVAA